MPEIPVCDKDVEFQKTVAGLVAEFKSQSYAENYWGDDMETLRNFSNFIDNLYYLVGRNDFKKHFVRIKLQLFIFINSYVETGH